MPPPRCPKPPGKPAPQRWRVSRTDHGKAQAITIVEGVDAEAAINLMMERYAITDPAEQKRLTAHRVV